MYSELQPLYFTPPLSTLWALVVTAVTLAEFIPMKDYKSYSVKIEHVIFRLVGRSPKTGDKGRLKLF